VQQYCKTAMMIYYITPHLNVAGGVKTLATHVFLLRSHGLEAWLVNAGEEREPWCSVLEHISPHIISLSSFIKYHNSDNAFIVIPESTPWIGDTLKGIRILLVLNWMYAEVFVIQSHSSHAINVLKPFPLFNPLSNLSTKARHWRRIARFGFHAIFTNAEFTRTWIRRRTGYDPLVIPTGIDRSVFFEEPKERKHNRLLMIYGKLMGEIDHTRAALMTVPSVELVAVKDLTEEEIAHEYRRSDVFLAFGKYEGLPRTVLEAMCSGCAVVGYDGGGGKECMHHRSTAMVAHTQGEITRYAQELIVNSDLKERIRAGGKAVSARYTLDVQSQRLLSALTAVKRASLAGPVSLNTNLYDFL
jgi:glycosyltransferase involved in cell wall biosynthesis